jgi:hypothetical protein
MKIESYTIIDNVLTLHFDCDFNQVSYIKMESYLESKSGDLECEEMEIRYSKNRNSFKTFIKDNSNTIVILIKKFNNENVSYGYYINKYIQKDKDQLLANGLVGILKSDTIKRESHTIKQDEKICPIKNQNIFAKIRKKV